MSAPGSVGGSCHPQQVRFLEASPLLFLGVEVGLHRVIGLALLLGRSLGGGSVVAGDYVGIEGTLCLAGGAVYLRKIEFYDTSGHCGFKLDVCPRCFQGLREVEAVAFYKLPREVHYLAEG